MGNREEMLKEMAEGFGPDERIIDPMRQQARAQEFTVLYLEQIDKKLDSLLQLMRNQQAD